MIPPRSASIAQIKARPDPWDVLVIGGGASGLGAAVDAAQRGYRTLLLEQHDFAKGTSSRSTKLVHGGVRYLKQGNISLVLEALRERGLLCQNANHLVHHLSFIVPAYTYWEGPFYGIGLKVYDQLAGKLGLKRSRWLSREKTLERLPNLEPAQLKGGVMYYDGQFDDARLAVNLMQTIHDLGGLALNYTAVTGLIKDSGLVRGVTAVDQETGEEYTLPAKVVINATGVFCDTVRRLDDPKATALVSPSQGVHLVLPASFLPGNAAIMVPHTTDGRVLFAVPWHDRVVVGTTDTPLDQHSLEPRALPEEIDFILNNAARYLARPPKRSDVLSVFAGLRPLVKAGEGHNTAALSRDHTILVADSGLITLTGGKWTTYRKMAEDVIDQAALVGGLPHHLCGTTTLRLHGCLEHPPEIEGEPGWNVYGSDQTALDALIRSQPELGEPLHTNLPFTGAHVVWAARAESARTVEDVLARRTRALLLDARASMQTAPKAARLLADELGRDTAWIDEQVKSYVALANGYLP